MSARGTPRSLAAQLSRTLTLWVCVVWLVSSAGVAWYVQSEITEGFDSALAESAERLLDLALHEVEEVRDRIPGSDAPLGINVATHTNTRKTHHTLLYQVVDGHQGIQLRSSDAPLTPLVATLKPGFQDTGPLRVYTLKHPQNDYYIHVADSLDNRRHAVMESMVWLLAPLLALLPLLAWLVRGTTRRELASVSDVARQLQARDGHDLRPIDEGHLPLELQTITHSTNHLLLRLSEALDVERALAANAAHELRTPLAAASLRLRSALDLPLEPAAHTEVAEAARALEQLIRRTEKLLQLSRAGSAAALARDSVDLVQLAGAVAQEFWAHAGTLNRLNLVVPEAGSVTVKGDFDVLAIALRNLVENALRYSAGAPVELEVRAPGTVIVSDSGPGVAPADLNLIRGRHVRSAQGQAGFGLGLSIVSAITERHEGRLSLYSPRRDGRSGLEAVLELPSS